LRANITHHLAQKFQVSILENACDNSSEYGSMKIPFLWV